MKADPTLLVSLHTHEGRALFQLDLRSMSDLEIAFMYKVFEKADKGQNVEFGIEPAPDGRPVMKFTIGPKLN